MSQAATATRPPHGTSVTPFNVAAVIILAVGIPLMIARFILGLGAVTNLSNTNPWGL